MRSEIKPNLAEASKPALIQANGKTIALLSYNCVGPEFSWASETTPGCAYVRILATDGGATRPQADLAEIDPASLAEMQREIAAAKAQADVVIVSLHKGITHRPAALAPYERPLAQAAIRAGADAVAGHHAHIARGIELFDGKPIFHGLGNGVVVTHSLSPAQDHLARAEWAERRKKLFGFEPDPAYPLAPFHPEAVNGLIGRLTLADDDSITCSLTPIWFEPPGRPIPAGDKAAAIVAYIDRIGTDVGLAPLDARPTADGRYVLG